MKARKTTSKKPAPKKPLTLKVKAVGLERKIAPDDSLLGGRT